MRKFSLANTHWQWNRSSSILNIPSPDKGERLFLIMNARTFLFHDFWCCLGLRFNPERGERGRGNQMHTHGNVWLPPLNSSAPPAPQHPQASRPVALSGLEPFQVTHGNSQNKPQSPFLFQMGSFPSTQSPHHGARPCPLTPLHAEMSRSPEQGRNSS